jgi:GNAT superfamily N-acetyltransferase
MAEPTIRPMGEPGDLGWVIQAHGERYAAEFGWDTSFEALVARIVADFADRNDAVREAGWVAELGGRRVGCVFCMAADDSTAQLRLLLVHPEARGRHLGRRLTDGCLDFARVAGYRRVRLWTQESLVAARRIYAAAGFRLVERRPHTSFGADLVGEYHERDLDLDLDPALDRPVR